MLITRSEGSSFKPSKIKNNPIVKSLRQTILLRQCDKKLSPLDADIVVFSKQAELQNQAQKIFSRSKKFTIEDYNALTKLEKSVLREASSGCEQAALDSLQIGIKVKEKLDSRYGDEGYVFCSIGTSPTGVGRVLEFMGAETKYLPISRLNWLHNVEDWKKHTNKFSNYQDFLNEQGLSKDSVSSSNKKYLFYDYVQQGMSLIVFEKMMKEYFGLDLPNVVFHNFNYLCQSSCAKNIDPPDYSLKYIHKYLTDAEMSKYGGVPHLDILMIDKIDECKNFESQKAKMFNFVIIDELSKRGLLKENPRNQNSL